VLEVSEQHALPLSILSILLVPREEREVLISVSQGIGRAISMKMALSGAHVAVLDRLESELAETKKLCEEFGITAKTYVVDVTDVAALRGVLDQAEKDLGEVE
jgi:NAD(P)-dependent dehydrogenase (short-subunit alcohol dehydrogenase family)